MIDVILHLEFERKGVFLAKIFILKLANEQSKKLERRRLEFVPTNIGTPESLCFPRIDILETFMHSMSEKYMQWLDHCMYSKNLMIS